MNRKKKKMYIPIMGKENESVTKTFPWNNPLEPNGFSGEI